MVRVVSGQHVNNRKGDCQGDMAIPALFLRSTHIEGDNRMAELRIAVVSKYQLECGCSGWEADIPGIGMIRGYESVCYGGTEVASKEDPIILFIREEAPMDLNRSDSQAESGYGFSLS
jgi:hypothetical protein